MLDQLEAKAAALEAQAEELKRKAAEIREVGARLAALLEDGAPPVKALPMPAGAGKRFAKLNARSAGAVPVTRTFKCKICKTVKDAAPRGAIPKVCKECKAEAAAKKQR